MRLWQWKGRDYPWWQKRKSQSILIKIPMNKSLKLELSVEVPILESSQNNLATKNLQNIHKRTISLLHVIKCSLTCGWARKKTRTYSPQCLKVNLRIMAILKLGMSYLWKAKLWSLGIKDQTLVTMEQHRPWTVISWIKPINCQEMVHISRGIWITPILTRICIQMELTNNWKGAMMEKTLQSQQTK